jgi:hypothetical protein
MVMSDLCQIGRKPCKGGRGFLFDFFQEISPFAKTPEFPWRL